MRGTKQILSLTVVFACAMSYAYTPGRIEAIKLKRQAEEERMRANALEMEKWKEEKQKQEENEEEERREEERRARQAEEAKHQNRIATMTNLTKELSTYLQSEFTNKLYFVAKIHDQLFDICKTSQQQDLFCVQQWDRQWGMDPIAKRDKILRKSEYLIRGVFDDIVKGKIENRNDLSLWTSKEGKSIEELASSVFRVNDIVFQLWDGQHYAISFQSDDVSRDSESIANLSCKIKVLLKEWLDEQYERACAFGGSSEWGRHFAQVHKSETTAVHVLKEIALGDTLMEVLQKISQMDSAFGVSLYDGTPEPSFTFSAQSKRKVSIPPMAYGRQYNITLKNHVLTLGFGGFDNTSAVNLLWARVAFKDATIQTAKIEELLTKRFPDGFAFSKKTKQTGMHWKDPENTHQSVSERYANAMVAIGMTAATRKKRELLKEEQDEYDRAQKTVKEIERKYMEPTCIYFLEAKSKGYDVVVNVLDQNPERASDFIMFDIDMHTLQVDIYNKELHRKADAAKREKEEQSKKAAEAALDI